VKAEAMRSWKPSPNFKNSQAIELPTAPKRPQNRFVPPSTASTNICSRLRMPKVIRHAVLRPFAAHLEKHLIIPSARYAVRGARHGRTGLAGASLMSLLRD